MNTRMNPTMNRAAALLVLLISPVAVLANETPLSPVELANCAQQVQTLRSDAPRLSAWSEDLEARRARINARGDSLKLDVAQQQKDDLQKGLALHDRRQQHNSEAGAFNVEIERFKREVAVINGLKDRYDRECSTRPFRRSDLMALPEAQRRAMQMGLADVVVPYIE